MNAEMKLAAAVTESDPPPYTTRVRMGRHDLVADEPAAAGGGDVGPAPYGLLLAALGACTTITLRMYAARHGWDIGAPRVDLSMTRVDDVERIERVIKLSSGVTPEQRARLAEIADKTPVTKTIKRGTPIETTVVTA
jgi:putative redox protein